MMKKSLIPAAVMFLLMIPSLVQADVQADSFDILGSVMDKTKKEIDSKSLLKNNKVEAEKFREKIIKGWWEFMQGKSDAKPGEYCMATFLQAKRDSQPGHIDKFKDGIAVMLSGPGDDYRGALLGFMPIDEKNAFPKLAKGKPVMVTLKQGNEKPVTLNAIYTTVGKADRPMILFAVPSIEALMGGMEDDWSFDVIYKDQSIANITWHSGLKAREELKQCLAGEPFYDKNPLKDKSIK